MTMQNSPHAGQPVLTAGPVPAAAKAALILVHGRGGDAADMLGLARMLAGPGMACLAPQAAGHSWYPYRFVEPTARNEPFLGSALEQLDGLVEKVLQAGIPEEKIALAGFSQGACLALEYFRRRGAPLGAVIGFSGGLIGESLPEVEASTQLGGTPVLLGCSERDAHIPVSRLRETDALLRRMGAEVTLRIRPGADHSVDPQDAGIAKLMLARLAG